MIWSSTGAPGWQLGWWWGLWPVPWVEATARRWRVLVGPATKLLQKSPVPPSGLDTRSDCHTSEVHISCQLKKLERSCKIRIPHFSFQGGQLSYQPRVVGVTSTQLGGVVRRKLSMQTAQLCTLLLTVAQPNNLAAQLRGSTAMKQCGC
uniref:Uncharacterized protein n=1 Tax=Myotis myotis TaxID=51298 RepID=A0A7J8AMZ4_MYOMY|nr:hypothetical protein mMyoMyo1_007966 [Myotis myotis]